MANVPLYQLTDVWNDSGITWTGFSLNVTDTGSALGSKLFDFKINGASKFSVAKDGALIGLGVRERLAADRTYYVRTDGNNANNGLADTSGGAWATLQYALDYLGDNIDINGKVITVQLQTGVTHAGANSSGKNISGKGAIFISGSAVNNTDTIITNPDDNGLSLGGNPLITWYVGGVKLQSGYYIPLYIRNVSVQLGSPDGLVPAPRFGAPGLSFAPLIQVDGPLAFCTTYSAGIIIDTGGTAPGFFIQAGRGAIASFGPVAFAATTTFNNAFVEATDNSVISLNTSDAVSGSAVGKRYNATTGGQVKRTSGTGGIDNLPGTVAGTWTAAIKNITGTLSVGGALTASSASFNNTLSMGTGQLISWADGGYFWASSGNVHTNNLDIADTTASTSPTTGALKVAGGLGVAGNANFGGAVIWSPPASIIPANNGQMAIEATSNTSVTIRLRGTDGTVRSAVLTLA